MNSVSTSSPSPEVDANSASEKKGNSLRVQRVKTLAHELADLLHRPEPAVQTKLQLFSKKLYATLQSTVHFLKPTALHKVRTNVYTICNNKGYHASSIVEEIFQRTQL